MSEMREAFLIPRLVGERFHDHMVPLEFLKDFSALQEMLVEVAKWKFLQENPKRLRVQRNFGKDIELRLEKIDDGSAKLVIVLAFATLCPTESASLFPPKSATYFEQAKAKIVNAIDLAAQGRSPELPAEFLGYFDRIGRSLRAGESIEFPNGSRTAILNTDVRKKLIFASKMKAWTEETALRARISAADQHGDSFVFELSDGTHAKAPLDDKYRDAVLDALKGYKKNGVFVLIQGIIQRDQQDRIKGFESVEDVTPLDPLDTALRLEQLALLQDGWLDGEGKAPAKDKLDWLAEAFDNNFDSDLPLPYLYPTAEGGVQAEWNLPDRSITLEIDLNTQQGEYQALNLKDQTCNEFQVALARPEGWKRVNEELKRLNSMDGGKTE